MRKQSLPPLLKNLELALDKESYEWMSANLSEVLDALENELADNPNLEPADLRRWVIRNYDREELANRIEQAARFILFKRRGGTR